MRGDRILRWLLWAIGYAALSWAGLQLLSNAQDVAAFWPASGVGVAAVVNLRLTTRSRLWAWTAVPAGYLLVALPVRGLTPLTVGFTVANALEAILAAEVLTRLVRTRVTQVGVTIELVAKFVIATVAAPLVSGVLAGLTVGAATGEWASAPGMAVTWWASDSIGMLAFGPLLLSLSAIGALWMRYPRSSLEVAAATGLMVLSITMLYLDIDTAYVFPGVFATLWWALRFGVGPTVFWIGIYSCAVALGTAQGIGPFNGSSSVALHMTQVFVTAYVLATLAVAAASQMRRQALADLQSRARELEHATTHDSLTGLPMLPEMVRRLTSEVPPDESVGIAVIDIDLLGQINDVHGRTVGDDVVRSAAHRFLVTKRDQDLLARLGGDEFVVVIRHTADEQAAEKVAAQLTDAMLLPVESGVTQFDLTISLGLAVGPARQFETLVREADMALHRAKADGRNRVSLRTQAQRRHEAEQAALVERFLPAIEAGEVFCHFQPICPVKTGVRPGAEALIRWRDAERGLLPPAVFLPPQERSGRMAIVGDFVLYVALAQVRQWRRSGEPDAPQWVSVNLSASELRDGDVHHRVATALARSKVEPQALVLEITEQSMVQMDAATRHQLQELRSMGVRIAIDDFGTGYSSLAYLARLPIDILKLDSAFVGDVGFRSDNRLLRAVCGLARDIGLTTVLEGVETEDQLRDAVLAGADAVQGFLLGRPGAARDVRVRPVSVDVAAPVSVSVTFPSRRV